MASEAGPQPVRESPLLAEFAGPGHVIGVHHRMRIVEHVAGRAPGANFIVDLSAIPRRLVAGRGAAAWLAAQDVACPRALHAARPLGAGGLIVHAHHDQYLLVDQPCGGAVPAVFAGAPGRRGETLVLECDMAEIALGGAVRDAALAELCAVELDLGTESWHSVHLARCEVALWQCLTPVPHTRVLCTAADARYLFGVLRACVREHGGAPIGFADYLALHA